MNSPVRGYLKTMASILGVGGRDSVSEPAASPTAVKATPASDLVALKYHEEKRHKAERFLAPGTSIDAKAEFYRNTPNGFLNAGGLQEIVVVLANGNMLLLTDRRADSEGFGVVSCREAEGKIIPEAISKDLTVTIGQPLSENFGVDAGVIVEKVYKVSKHGSYAGEKPDVVGELRLGMLVNPGLSIEKKDLQSPGAVVYLESTTKKHYQLRARDDGSIEVLSAFDLSKRTPAVYTLKSVPFHVGQKLVLEPVGGAEGATFMTSPIENVALHQPTIGIPPDKNFARLKSTFENMSSPELEEETKLDVRVHPLV